MCRYELLSLDSEHMSSTESTGEPLVDPLVEQRDTTEPPVEQRDTTEPPVEQRDTIEPSVEPRDTIEPLVEPPVEPQTQSLVF